MSFLSGMFFGITVCCIILLIALFVIFPQSNTYPNDLVKCSEYYKITEKYRTLDGNYVRAENGITIKVFDSQYNQSFVGGYVKTFDSNYYSWYKFTNLTPVNESEYGYRGACRVLS